MFQRHSTQNEIPMLITTVTQNRQKIFSNDAYAREAVETLYRVQQLHPFFLFAFVIMPNHCHFLVNVPPPERISRIMNVYKAGVSHNIGIGPFWQSRFHVKLSNDSWKLFHYIHQNPVKARLVEHPEEYPWSSACGKWDVSPIDAW